MLQGENKLSSLCRQRGYGGSVPRRFLANAPCIHIHKKKLVPQVATRWKEERKSNERPLQAGQMSREKDSRGIERSLSSKKCDAKGAADSRKCRGKIYCEFNALTLKGR